MTAVQTENLRSFHDALLIVTTFLKYVLFQLQVHITSVVGLGLTSHFSITSTFASYSRYYSLYYKPTKESFRDPGRHGYDEGF